VVVAKNVLFNVGGVAGELDWGGRISPGITPDERRTGGGAVA
jgi:hypothetical protein